MPLPAEGVITQTFGADESGLFPGLTWNKGVDIGAPLGSPVRAVATGRVVFVGDDGAGWGLRVIIQDDYGNLHSYGHLSRAAVRAGDRIEAGALIGAVGNTGLSTGPHLSYDVRDAAGNYFDPMPLVQAASFSDAERWLGQRSGGSRQEMTQEPIDFSRATADITTFPSGNVGGLETPRTGATTGQAAATGTGATAGAAGMAAGSSSGLPSYLDERRQRLAALQSEANAVFTQMLAIQSADPTGYFNDPDWQVLAQQYNSLQAGLELEQQIFDRMLDSWLKQQADGGEFDPFRSEIDAWLTLVQLGEISVDEARNEIDRVISQYNLERQRFLDDQAILQTNEERARQLVADEMTAWREYTGGLLDIAQQNRLLFEAIAPRLVASSEPVNVSQAVDQLLARYGFNVTPTMIQPVPVNIPDVQGSFLAALSALQNPPPRVGELIAGTAPAPTPFPTATQALGPVPPLPPLAANPFVPGATAATLNYVNYLQGLQQVPVPAAASPVVLSPQSFLAQVGGLTPEQQARAAAEYGAAQAWSGY